MKGYQAMAKGTFAIEKENGTQSKFIRDQVYACVKRSNGNFVIGDLLGSAVELKPEYALECFWIKDN